MSHLSKGCRLPNHEARRLLSAQTEARKPKEEPKSYKQLGQKLGSWSRPHPFFFWVSAMQNIIFGVGPYFMAVSFKREWVRVSPKQPGLSSFQSCDHHVREDRCSDAPRALVRLPWLAPAASLCSQTEYAVSPKHLRLQKGKFVGKPWGRSNEGLTQWKQPQKGSLRYFSNSLYTRELWRGKRRF